MKRLIPFTLLTIVLLLYATCINAQYILSGKVQSSGGKALPQASIRLLLSKTTATTDEGGSFQLKVNTIADSLLVSHVGYKAQKVFVRSTAKQPLMITLVPDAQALDEVTVSYRLL